MEIRVCSSSCSHCTAFLHRLFVKVALAACMGAVSFSASASVRIWTNTVSGSWSVPGNWSPNGVPNSSDNAYITNSGTYTVYATNAVSISSGVVGGIGNSGVQTLVIDGGITFTCGLWNVFTNGELVVSNATYSGHIAVRTNGVMRLEGSATKTFTSLLFYNFGGVVLWRGGTLVCNGGVAWFENDGLWQMEGDNSWQPSATSMLWTNNGIFRKTGGSGETRIYNFDFVNNPGALVDAQSGTLTFSTGQTNILGGTFNADAGATMTFSGGTYYDAGANFTGAGLNQFYSSALNLRTNDLPGLKLTGGQVVLGANFQQSGMITNLALDGANLSNTNALISGNLTVNSGTWSDRLTVLPGGQLTFASTIQKNVTARTIINQGIVDWTGGTINLGNAGAVSNGGVWKMESDDELYSGGGPAVLFTNAGTFYKSAGAGGTAMTRIESTRFFNLDSGVIEVDAGILRMPQNYTNASGTLKLNGGTLAGSTGANSGLGPLYLGAGHVEGSGTIGQLTAFGGTISPGSGPGLLSFQSDVNLGAGSVLSIDGTGTVPGTGYDQLSVTGAVAVSNCTLQVTSLPAVPVGTSFTIINNDGSDAVLGTFAGLPENSVVSTGAGTYRIHYAGGTGNDVTLVAESGTAAVAPTLSSVGYSNGMFRLSGTGNSTLVYTVQASTNFLQWTNIGTATGDVGGALNFLDTNASKFRYRFYRTTN